MLLILWRPVLHCGNRWWQNQSPWSNWKMFIIQRWGQGGMYSRLNKSHTEIRKRKARLALWETESQSLLLAPYFHFLLPFQPFIITFHSFSFIKLNKSTFMHCWQKKTLNHYCRLLKTQFLFKSLAQCQWRKMHPLDSRWGFDLNGKSWNYNGYLFHSSLFEYSNAVLKL